MVYRPECCIPILWWNVVDSGASCYKETKNKKNKITKWKRKYSEVITNYTVDLSSREEYSQ